MTPDEELMSLALDEAVLGGRAVRPNPRVGCALRLQSGFIVKGHHERYGEGHAEVNALAAARNAGLDVQGATVAVTLEPCAHHGRTPPCAEALAAAGVARVLVGVDDPFPQVSGHGIARLREAGIEVVENVLRPQAEAINREWLFAQRKGRPFVTLKMATSLDGLWTSASGESQWITGPSARARGHELRARVDAIITGTGTVKADNPKLTARDGERELPEQPRVFVLSQKQPLELGSYQLSQPVGRAESRVVSDLGHFLGELKGQGFFDVLIEGGPRLASAFLEASLVDELWLFLGARLLGGEGRRLEALHGGRLPGFEMTVFHQELLPEGDLLLKLQPKLR